jgi:hypothetical protein
LAKKDDPTIIESSFLIISLYFLFFTVLLLAGLAFETFLTAAFLVTFCVAGLAFFTGFGTGNCSNSLTSFSSTSKPPCQNFGSRMLMPASLRMRSLALPIRPPKDLEILRLERFSLRLELLIQSQHQQLTEGIRIDIERHLINVRDADPFPFEFIAQFERVAELFLEIFKVGIAQVIHRGVLLHQLMRGLLEQRKIGLAHDGRIGVIHLLEEDIAPHGFIRLSVSSLSIKTISANVEAVSASGRDEWNVNVV